MVLKANIVRAGDQGVNIELLLREENKDDILLQTVYKSYTSLEALYGLVTKWYKKEVPKVSNPNSLFSPPSHIARDYNQEFIDKVLQQMDPESFPVKAFFRLYDLKGKVIIITGASSGIGKQNAYQLAAMGAHIILACRSEQKTLPIVEDIKKVTHNENVEYMNLDLVDLKNVRSFVENFKAKNLPLHVLINNAGCVLEGKTDYGIDSTFGINHVGPAVLTMGLLDILRNTENSRVIILSSTLASSVKTLPFDKIRAGIPQSIFNATEAYGYSKLANVLFAKSLDKHIAEYESEKGNADSENGSGSVSLNRKFPKVFALHPGAVATDIWRAIPSSVSGVMKKFMLSEEEGSWMTLYLAIDPGCDGHSGKYFHYNYGTTPVHTPTIVLGRDFQNGRFFL